MRKSLLLAACVLPLFARSALADDYYEGRYHGNNYDSGSYGYDDYRYGGDNFYRRYRRYLNECKQHRRLHRELNEFHEDAHDEGFDYRGEHGDVHDALDATHEQWHRDHSGAGFCQSFGEYRSRHYGSRHYERRGYGSGGSDDDWSR